MRKLLGAALIVFLAACGDDETKNKNVQVNPTGSVFGAITNAQGAPIAGATIHVQATGYSNDTTTDASGKYVMNGVPAGGYVECSVTAQGYAPYKDGAYINGALNDGGDLPTDNGNVTFDAKLIRTDSTFTFALAGLNDASAPAAVDALMTVNYNSEEPLLLTGSYANGIVTFTGAPNPTDLLVACPWAYTTVVIDDTSHFYRASVTGYNPSNLDQMEGQTTLVALNPADGTNWLNLVSSNVQNLIDGITYHAAGNTISSGAAISGVFNDEIGQAFAYVTDELGTEIPTTATIGLNGYGLSVSPTTGQWQPGMKYNVEVQVVSAQDPSQMGTVKAPFFVSLPQAGLPLAIVSATWYDSNDNSQVDPGEVIDIQLNQYIGSEEYTFLQIPVVASPEQPTWTSAIAAYPAGAAPVEPITTYPASITGMSLCSGYSDVYRFTWPNAAAPATIELATAFKKFYQAGGLAEYCGGAPCTFYAQDLSGTVLGMASSFSDPSVALTRVVPTADAPIPNRLPACGD